MLALASYRLSHCPDCGEPKDESYDTEMDGAYVAVSLKCFGCAAIAHASHGFAEDPASSAVRYRLEKKRRR